MSCTPTSALSRSLSPLSPSDESRFVPRSSVASSINEQHFTAAEMADKVAGKGDVGVNIAAAVGVSDQDAKERAQDVDDDEKSGIVGATICFTPEPSPKSGPRPSPLFQEALPNIGSLTIDTSGENYIGSVAAVGSGSSGLVASSRMGSASMHVASSLDGRSTTEYEMLDHISSKGSIEVEDLILDGEEDDGHAGSGGVKSSGGKVTPLASLSPCGTVPSLDEAPLETFTSAAKTSTSEVPSEVKVDTSVESVAAADDDEPKSPKVDSRPLHPFKNLHKYWEARSSNLAHMTKSTLGRFFGKDATQSADVDVSAMNSEQDAATKPTEDTDSAAEVEASVGAIVNAKALTFAAVKAYLSSVAASVGSFVASALLFLAVLMRGSLSTWLGSISKLVGRLLLRKASMLGQDAVEAEKTPRSEALASADGPVDPPEPEGVNLSKLFADEASKDESKVGLEPESAAHRNEAEEPQPGSNEDSAVALDRSSKASLNRIADLVTGFLAAKMKKALAVLKAKQVLSALTPLFVLANVFLLCVYMLRRGAGVAQGSESGLLGELVDRLSTLAGDNLPRVTFEEDDLRCALTDASSYASIDVSELNLSPTFSGVDESELSGSSSWLWMFGMLAVAVSVGCAFLFKSKLPFLSDKHEGPSILTGMWTDDEHEQFLRGFKIHGKRWKLVSAFVPSRTPTQVRKHGSYWLKMRSPDGMKKSRRSSTPAKTPELSNRRSLDTPGSVSSRKTTPRMSNKSKTTPKGILVEKKDHNLRFKNVTPRSEERNRRMKKTNGPTSDPPKRRVRVKSP